MPYGDKIFGLRDVKLTNITGTVQVDLSNAMTLKFAERLVSGELKGDDRLQAVMAFPEAVEWELSAGGITLAAWALMTGRTATEAGSQPNRTNTLTADADDLFPYFKIYGKAMGDDGTADIHCKLYKCKLTKAPEGSFQNGEFFQTGVSGLAIDDGTNGIYTFVQNETATTLPTT